MARGGNRRTPKVILWSKDRYNPENIKKRKIVNVIDKKTKQIIDYGYLVGYKEMVYKGRVFEVLSFITNNIDIYETELYTTKIR